MPFPLQLSLCLNLTLCCSQFVLSLARLPVGTDDVGAVLPSVAPVKMSPPATKRKLDINHISVKGVICKDGRKLSTSQVKVMNWGDEDGDVVDHDCCFS